MKKKVHSSEFKAKVVIEAIQELKMINQIASKNGITPNLLSRWKTEAITNLPEIFSKETAEIDKIKQNYESKIEELYTQIGKQSIELEWLKKNLKDELTPRQRLKLIDTSSDISISRQCEILGINRSTLYYRPAPPNLEELEIKQIIDNIYTKKPIYGYRRVTEELMNVYGIKIDRKTTLKYMQSMGIQAIYPKPNLSKPAQGHSI